ncbi:NifB/NifX family molybdenum-iron cluster-binding protein [uncultured Sphaerochaeta sp.]|uniref:NifB/NifX family molybdenum-iron cluster-binding protein n=1 Tax=uncultured Sphaerochaeta sp. TaxID=886478 RepID=UPI002A0A683E|nr:NifB/NifX family molybdenum-iron cluster-binding protein [uncultured Sphaerochaeta sp.]
MIIAIPSDGESLDTSVCVSFGRTPFYCLYDTETKECEFKVNEAAESPGGAGIMAAQTLVDKKVATLITIRCGENAAKILQSANISLYKALDLSIADNIDAFLNKKLSVLESIHPGFHNGH